jgi:hypothetical protein
MKTWTGLLAIVLVAATDVSNLWSNGAAGYVQ